MKITPSPFDREIRLFVFGGLVFVLFLAGASLVGMSLTTDWAVRESLRRAEADHRALADRLRSAASPEVAIASDSMDGELFRASGALQTALYRTDGTLVAQAAFSPGTGLSPQRLAAEDLPGPGRPAARLTELSGQPAIVVVGPFGSDLVLWTAHDGSAAAVVKRTVGVFMVVVPVGALTLLALVAPFLRKLLRPIEELTETARQAGSLVEETPRAPGEPDAAIRTFQKTIDELRRRTSELEGLRREEARRADELGEMSAGIAHEFRNATATILGWVRLAAASDDQGERTRHLGRVREEAEHVARVTGDFLLFARPERFSPEPTDLGALVADAVAEAVAEEELSAPGVIFETLGEPGSADVDGALLRRALVNLLRNAREAAPADGGRVRIQAARESDGTLRIAVEDNGPGIQPGTEERLFVPFFSTKASGTGLGLALVSRVASLHGGSARTGRSEELGGASFVLTLPARSDA